MSSKDTPIILLTLTTALFLFLTLFFLNENTKIRQLSEQTTMSGNKELNFNLNVAMTGRSAPNVLLITNDGKEKYLSELMSEKPVLVYRYTQNNCIPCYERQIRLLQEIFEDIPLRVGILSSYHNTDDFLSSNKVSGVPMYHIPFDAFTWRAERYNAPYFFVLHPCLRVSNIFVPNELEPELTRRYLESIKRLLQ